MNASAGQKTTVKLRLQTDDGATPCDFFEPLLSVNAASGKCGPSLLMMPRLHGGVYSLGAENVRFRSGKLSGTAVFRIKWPGTDDENVYRVALKGTENGDKITGRFTIEKSRRDSRGRTSSEKFSGRLMGEVIPPDAPPPPGMEIGPGHDWPAWRGPFSNGTAVDSGLELVDSLAKAKLAWLSDEQIPNSYGSDARGAGRSRFECVNQGGYAAPLVLGNRVIQYYFTPSGPTAKVWYTARRTDGRLSQDWGIMADDVFHCFDARTGRTLWKTVFKESGLSITSFSKGGGLLSPSSWKGKVYGTGPGGGVFCVDGKTGEPLWQSNLGPRAEWQKHNGAACRRAGHLMYFNRDFGSAVCIADGVVVCHDYLSHYVGPRWHGTGVMGFDADTGARLWHYRDSVAWHDCPLTWRHGGKEYVIVTGGSQGASCIEPRTGKVLWTIPGAKGRHALTEDMMVSGTDEGITAWKISPQGAEQTWVLKGEGNPPGFSAINKGRFYTLTKSGYLCVDMKTGKILAKHPIRRNTYMSFAVADGRVFQGLLMLNADPKNFRPMGTLDLDYANSTSHAYADGRLFFRTRRRLACLDLRKSAEPSGDRPDGDLLLAIIGGNRAELRKAAGEGLKICGPEIVPKVVKAAGSALKKNDYRRFKMFSDVLISCGAPGREAVKPMWLQAMESKSCHFFESARDILFAGGKVSEQEALPILFRLAAEGNAEVQPMAVQVLFALDKNIQQQAKPMLLNTLQKDRPGRWPAVTTALLKIDPDSAERVMRRLTTAVTGKDRAAATTALTLLGEHGAKHAHGAVRKHILDSLAGVFSGDNAGHMALAANALGRFKADAKSAIPAMEKAYFKFDNKALRDAIKAAVESIQPGRKLKLKVDAMGGEKEDDLDLNDL